MAASKALLLAGAAALASHAAQAADMLPPPPMLDPPPLAAAYAPEFSGWYLRGDVGVSKNTTSNWKLRPDPMLGGSTSVDGQGNTVVYAPQSYDFFGQHGGQSFSGGVGFGYQWSSWLHFDITGEYRGGGQMSAVDQFLYTQTTTPAGGGAAVTNNFALNNFYKGNLSSLVLLANGYLDLGSWYGISPFVGGGVGVAYNRIGGLTDTGFTYVNGGQGTPTGGFFTDGGKTSFAWALMAGLGYQVSSNLRLELGYRYLNLGTFRSGVENCFDGNGGFAASCSTTRIGFKMASNEIRFGMRWMLGDAPPPPPPPAPIVRKY